MHRVRSLLIVAVIVSALVTLTLRATDIPMPGWFAAVVVTISLALAGLRFVPRRIGGAGSRS